MIQVDVKHNAEVRQRFVTDYSSIKNQILSLQNLNNQISVKLYSLLEKNKAIQAKCFTGIYPPTYTFFCNVYAPKLWEFILSTHLPNSQAEAILINTLIKAWQQFDPHTLREKHLFSRLLRLACSEGLPTDCLKAILQAEQIVENNCINLHPYPSANETFS
ncbi:hypothetical protein GO755_20795 [Spirosoma sp. HMF4905]|uniref:Uncharacterized protein n=1 Tax=Spirosoma arboris TaxID=2682092 RepID=A0A7K1SFA6_9BACT|nr:hypothetical protein [Spirosoma arboris]MVM32492.1 hypothetical protein [Spirosoma arboris]